MSWFYEKFSEHSELNGEITCQRILGNWQIYIGGAHQSSDYLQGIWRRAMRKLPKNLDCKNILVLGLGRGVNYPLRLFPNARLTVVEWDPKIIELAKRFGFIQNPERVQIIQGDAAAILPSLRKNFDLIIVDLFQGKKVAAAVQESFFKSIQKILNKNGAVLLNVFEQLEIISLAQKYFNVEGQWLDRYNQLAILKQKIPDDFMPFRFVPEYLTAQAQLGKFSAVHSAIPGMQWQLGPIKFVKYLSDRQPDLKDIKQPAIIIWQRMNSAPKPKGWFSMSIVTSPKCTGFLDLSADYKDSFSSNVQKQLKKWQQQKESCELIAPNPEEFLQAYSKTEKPKDIINLHTQIFKDKLAAHGKNLRLLALRLRHDRNIVGGLAFLDLPGASVSAHIISFIHDQAKETPVGFALIELWLEHCKSNNIKYADFDILRAPGDPKSWQGYSDFKKQFGLQQIQYPPALVKFFRPNQNNPQQQ